MRFIQYCLLAGLSLTAGVGYASLTASAVEDTREAELNAYLATNDSLRQLITPRRELREFILNNNQVYTDLLANKLNREQLLKAFSAAQKTNKKSAITLSAQAKNKADQDIAAAIVALKSGQVAPMEELPTTGTDQSAADIENAIATLGQQTPPPVEQAPPPTTQLVELQNINEVPSHGVDANGWPQHLNVPVHCPPPQLDRKYIHESVQYFKLSGPNGGRSIPPRAIERNGHSKEISHYLGGPVWGWRWHELADADIYAIPFITTAVVNSRLTYAEDGVGQKWSDQNPFYRPVTPVFTISECPGVLTAEGAQSFQTGGVVSGVGARTVRMSEYEALQAQAETTYAQRQANPGLQHYGKQGVLKPGTQYFFNIGYENVDTCEQDYNSIDYTNIPRNAQGKAICGGFLGTNQANGFKLRPPYTGPCLPNGPYPINYNSLYCQGSQSFAADANPPTWKYRCIDPKGNIAEQRYEMKVVNGRVSWIQGANTPAHARMLCGFTAENGFDDIPMYEICGRHAEGYSQSVFVLGSGNYPLGRAVTKCQFDESQKAYAWVNIVDDPVPAFIASGFGSTPTSLTTGAGMFMQTGSNHIVLSRFTDANGNEVVGTFSRAGDMRLGGVGSAIDPRWENPQTPLSQFRP